MASKIEITATFDDDSKRFHRFIIDEGQGIAGSIYVPKDSQGIPEFVNIRLRTKAKADAEKKEASDED